MGIFQSAIDLTEWIRTSAAGTIMLYPVAEGQRIFAHAALVWKQVRMQSVLLADDISYFRQLLTRLRELPPHSTTGFLEAFAAAITIMEDAAALEPAPTTRSIVAMSPVTATPALQNPATSRVPFYVDVREMLTMSAHVTALVGNSHRNGHFVSGELTSTLPPASYNRRINANEFEESVVNTEDQANIRGPLANKPGRELELVRTVARLTRTNVLD